MQVMLVGIALYAGEHYGIEARFEQMFRWLAMALTVPVLPGPGRSFFTGALAPRQRTPHDASLDLSAPTGAAPP